MALDKERPKPVWEYVNQRDLYAAGTVVPFQIYRSAKGELGISHCNDHPRIAPLGDVATFDDQKICAVLVAIAQAQLKDGAVVTNDSLRAQNPDLIRVITASVR